MILPAIFLGLVAASFGQDVITFSDDEEEGREEDGGGSCLTVSGEQCQLPFIFRGLTRTGCITDSDPAGLLWCSTRLDSQGRHVAGGGHWDHCQPGCPQHAQKNTTQASQASSELSDGSQGTCCVSISTDNVINIIDTPLETVALPGSVDTEQADDIIIRSSLGQEDDRVRFASEEPA